MNNKSPQQISQDIDNGSYFKNGLRWHLDIFLKPNYERNIVFVVIIFVSICSTILFFQIRSWFPIKVSRPVVIETSIDSDYYLTMDKMSHKYKNPDYSVLSYLLKNFVRLMEEYKKDSTGPLEIDSRIKKVANNATKEITDNFADVFFRSDASNPIKRFGVNGTRIVTVHDIDLHGIDESFVAQIKSFGKAIFKLPRSATVNFSTLEKNFLGEEKKQKWVAKINFLFSGVILEEGDGKEGGRKLSIPQFTITNYHVNELRR